MDSLQGKNLFINFLDSNTGKISPVSIPKDQSITPNVIYENNGFIVSYTNYKDVNKNYLDWDKIDHAINNGFVWTGDHYGSIKLQIRLHENN